MSWVKYCQVGKHLFLGEYSGGCAACGKLMCHKHRGNPQVSAGQFVSCVDCVAIVEEMNRIPMYDLAEFLRQRREGGTR